MVKVYIITEGQSDLELLKKLLPPELTADVKFVVGGGRYGAQTLAGSLLADRRLPVVLVVDADSLDEATIQERQRFLDNLLGQPAGHVDYRVLIARPALDAILFSERDLFTHITGIELDDVTWATAKFQPRLVLQQVLGDESDQIAVRLNDSAVLRLRQQPLIAELIQFLMNIVVQPT
jgi:hypothetical protein